jgi:hypothetical protein
MPNMVILCAWPPGVCPLYHSDPCRCLLCCALTPCSCNTRIESAARCVYRWGQAHTPSACFVADHYNRQSLMCRAPPTLGAITGPHTHLGREPYPQSQLCPTPYDVQRRTKLCAVVVEADAEMGVAPAGEGQQGCSASTRCHGQIYHV